MINQREELPLIDKAVEDNAARAALLLSLTPEITGLSLRRHNSMIRLLCSIATDGFSDGHTTNARTKVIGKSVGRDRSTVFRRLADARALGIIDTKPREGAVGQQLSSERCFNWSRVKELVGLRQELAAAERSKTAPPRATPPSQMRPPRRICDTPVAYATPNNPDSPDNPDNSKSGGSDRSKVWASDRATIAEADVRDLAGRLFRKMRYAGNQGATLWLAAAAVELGKLDEASVSTAAELAAAAGKGPGYFRVVLAEKASLTLPELSTLFDSIRVTPRLPGAAPALERSNRPVPALRAPPPPLDGYAATHAARQTLQRTLATLADSEPLTRRNF